MTNYGLRADFYDLRINKGLAQFRKSNAIRRDSESLNFVGLKLYGMLNKKYR